MAEQAAATAARPGGTGHAVAAPTAAAPTGPNKAETPDQKEKQEADKALKERLEKEGPSPLRVASTPTEVDRLRDQGEYIQEPYIAPLPGGGPSALPGMSAGVPTISKPEVNQLLNEHAELREKNRVEALEKQKKQAEEVAKNRQEAADREEKRHVEMEKSTPAKK